MSSDSESEDDENRPTGRVQNAFAGLNMDSSSSSEEEEDDDHDQPTQKDKAAATTNEYIGSDESSSGGSSSDEEEHDATKGSLDGKHPHEILDVSTFEQLAGRITSNGTILSPDFVKSIQQLIGSSNNNNMRPTEIQQQSWSTLLSPSTCDRDVIAISKTGSGKTLAFLVPLLASLARKTPKQSAATPRTFVHPRAIVLAPTRVLAQQIFEVATALVTNTPSLDVTVSAALGGAGYHQQMANLLETDPDLIIATPGRLNSLCGHVAAQKESEDTGGLDTTTTESPPSNNNNNNNDKVEMCIKLDEVVELVIDEADMMLALGFKDDLAWFAQLVNEESAYGFRLVLTSATWDEETSANLSQFESISEEEPVLLMAGGAGTGQVVTKNVTQRVEVLFQKGAPRFNRLCKLLEGALKESSDGEDEERRIIVFCLHKSQARQIGKDLRNKMGIENVVLEGDMSQSARVAAMEAFRKGTQGRVLVATDVAARGLDFNVSHVFNYSLGISIESYIHRCGRTGRAGRFGVAHTFVVKGVDEKFTPELCVILRQANQLVPDDLRIMAGKELKRRKQRESGSGASGAQADKNNEKNDEDDIEEARRANREKQLRLNQQRQRSSKQQQKRRGRR